MTKIQLDISKYSGDAEKRLKYIVPANISTFFSDEFMQIHTNSKTFVEFCETIGCDLFVDKDKLEDGDFDFAIKTHSKFSSWSDMLNTAFQTLVDEN